MWAAITASVFIALALCNAEEKLKWSKPDSEQTNSDWVPLSADQLGQASARSLGPPPQQNHLVHGLFQQDAGFQQPFQQQNFRPNEHQQNFRPNEHQQNFRPNDQNKFLHPQVLSQQFLPPPPPPQIPQHLLSQQLPPQFLNQQFESNFNQFSPGSPILGSQFAPPKDQFVHSRPEPPRQHFNDFLTEQKLPGGNLQFPSQNPQNSFSGPITDDEATPKLKGNAQEEKEQVQILYVPVETLKQRGKEASKGNVNQPIPQTITQPAPQVTSTQPPQTEIQKETKKFRHPIQPLKEQAPAREYSNFDINSFAPQKTKPEKTQYFQEEFDSVKDTTSQHVTTSQFQDGQETKFFKPAQQDYDVQYPTREPSFGQTDFKQFQDEKEYYTERPAPEFSTYNRFSDIPSRSPLNNERQHQTEVFHETSTKLPPPNQPPLSVYMETSPNSKVGDVLGLLKDAKTIPVLDTIGPDSPQVFVGPSNLKPPHGYVKFELPYLSSLDGNRVEKKVLQLPFFVAPLNFQPPPGFSKIPFPPPHIGSVVLSNNTAKSVTEKYATTPVPHVYSTTFRDPYTIPADISSISPQLPSLINSLQEEEQYGPTTIYSTSPAEPVTDAPVETVPPTTTTKRPLNSRRNNFRGSQRTQYTSTTPSSDSKRQRQRRPIQSRTQSRFHVTSTPSTTTTTTTESYVSSTISQSYTDTGDQRSKDDSSSVANQQQNIYQQENERQFEDSSKNKNFDANYQPQDFIPQYTPSYYQSDKGEKTVSPSHHATEFTSVTKDSFDASLTDSFRPQSQPESGQTYFSSFDSQFPASSINYEDNRQTFKEQVKEKSRNVIETTTETFLGRPQYRPTAAEAPFAYEESPVVPIGQLPPAETVHDFAPKHKVHHSNVPQFVQTLEGSTPSKQGGFISDSHKQQDSFIDSHKQQDSFVRDSPKQQDSFVRDSPKQQDSFIRDFSPDYNSEYTTQQNYQRPQSDFKDYPSPVLNRHNIPTTDSPVVEKETYRPTYSTEEDIRVTQKIKHRGRHEHKSQDEYRTKTTESYVETTTSDRPVTRSRGRIRGRPLTSRPKTTTEPPNYPSNFGLVSQPTTEVYQEEKKVSTESYVPVTEPVYTTQPTSEATTKNARRKFSNTRTVHRRVRPTSSSAVPSETTTSSPSGTKYLIRTRRPANAPQVTKLSTGRSRIRRPTTPASTTTEAVETEKWTVPQLPGLVYNQDESNSRSSVGVTKFETYQTTPTSRFEERPKSSESFYQSRDDEPVTRRHRPTHTTFDDYQPDEVVTVRGKIHKVTARPHRPILDAESEQDSNQSIEKRFKHRDETRVLFKARAKHRGTQQPHHQDENEEGNSQESQEVRRPSLRHKESHSTPAYYDGDEKVVYRSDDHKQAQVTTPSALYRQRESESSEEKYSSERGVTEKPRVAQQKDSDDFWNQGVTIQQSKSFDYSPEEELPRKTKSKPKSVPQFNEYDDYFGFQDQEKHATPDQSPFPSNDQQVTYTGLKPDIDVGKASQYPEKEKDKEIVYVEKEASTEGIIKEETPSTESTPTSEAEQPKTNKPGRKRGMWVRVRVKKPKDVFETAESQRFGSLNLLTNAKEKTDEKWSKEKETVVDTTQLNNSSSPSLMEQFQNTLKNMMTSYMNGETTPKDAEKTTTPPAETTAIYEPTTPQIQTTEEDFTTVQTSTNDEITTTPPVTSAYSEETVDPKVLGTSTTTEISLETEICYKGRCVKTKRSKDKVKDESDLMTVE